jgi:hypothetical protein
MGITFAQIKNGKKCHTLTYEGLEMRQFGNWWALMSIRIKLWFLRRQSYRLEKQVQREKFKNIA